MACERAEAQEKLENSASGSPNEKAGTGMERGWGKRREYLSFKILGESPSSFPWPTYLWAKVGQAKVEPDLVSGMGKPGIHPPNEVPSEDKLIKTTNRALGRKLRMDSQEKHS